MSLYYSLRLLSPSNVLTSYCLSLQLQKFRDELRNRSRVLKKLGHIDADGVVQLKGRAACLIDTGDELLVTELMFNGTTTYLASPFLSFGLSGDYVMRGVDIKKSSQVLSMIWITTK